MNSIFVECPDEWVCVTDNRVGYFHILLWILGNKPYNS